MKTKKTIGILPLLLIYFGATFNIAIAENPEVKIIALDSQGNPFSINMCVYYFVNSTRNIAIAGCGDTDDNFGTYPVNGVQKTINGAFDIGDSDTNFPTLSGVPAADKIYISIGNYFCELTFEGGERGDLYIVYFHASNSFSLLHNDSGYSVSGTYTWNDKTITLRNNMGKDNATGIVYLNSESIQTNSSGATRTRDVVTFPHTISGEEQSIFGVFRKWRNWDNNVFDISQQLNSANYDLTAKYAMQYTASISTSMGGGYVYVNSNQHNCPTSGAYIYDDLNNSITAPDQEYNGFSCTFSQWKESGSFKSSQNTIYYNEPSTSTSLEAVFTKKISNVGEGVYFGSSQSNPIVINWTVNPNATGYEIWRKVRTNGVWGDPYQIATVNSGVGTYTDNDYKLNAWKQGTELEYDVRAYSSSYSQDPQWATVYGSVNSKYNESLAENILTDSETPTDYSIGNHPNPFNPTTTINYQLPQDGMVTIKVYDIIGKEVATLVNEQKSAGYYKVQFNARHLERSREITSGVYIATIQASGFNKSIKLLLTK